MVTSAALVVPASASLWKRNSAGGAKGEGAGGFVGAPCARRQGSARADGLSTAARAWPGSFARADGFCHANAHDDITSRNAP